MTQLSQMKNKLLLIFCLLVIPFMVYGSELEKYEVKVRSSLNVRSNPNANSKSLGSLRNGEIIDVFNVSNGWAKINYGGQTGYVSSKHISPALNNFSIQQQETKSTDLKEIIVYIILGLSCAIFILRLIFKDEEAEGALLITKYTLFIALCFFQVYYFLILKEDTWFCSPDKVGWVWTIVNFFLYAGILFNQFLAFLDIMGNLQYNSNYIDYRIGFYSIGIAIGLCIIGFFFFAPFIPIIIILFGIAQLVQIVLIFTKNGNQWGYSIASTVFYLVGLVSFLITLAYFIPLLIIALLVWIVLCILGSSSSSSCSGCRSYNNGYCYYRNEYVSSGGHCRKYES